VAAAGIAVTVPTTAPVVLWAASAIAAAFSWTARAADAASAAASCARTFSAAREVASIAARTFCGGRRRAAPAAAAARRVAGYGPRLSNHLFWSAGHGLF
jgi:hypothetical protein